MDMDPFDSGSHRICDHSKKGSLYSIRPIQSKKTSKEIQLIKKESTSKFVTKTVITNNLIEVI